MECICLKVEDGQRGFMTNNARFLVEAQFGEDLHTRAVYSDDAMVGFTLFGYDPELPGRCTSQLMIDAQYQGRGLGKETVLCFLDLTRERMRVWELCLHMELENMTAHGIYQKLGFRAIRETQYIFSGAVYRERRMKIRL